MIYLDYSATTPVSYDVLESYNKTSRDYIGNPNSIHALGMKSRALLNSATNQIAQIFNVLPNEIIYTSGATESNNMAVLGVARKYKSRGNHIIISKLEHPSMYEITKVLEKEGFEIDYVDNNDEGLIDFEDLRNKIKETTILVSICGVNSETGVRQPLKTIRQIIKKENLLTIFHSDLTQGIGKVSVNLRDVDLASMSIHKVFGPKGIGILFKSDKIDLEPVLIGSSKDGNLRPGTPALPLIVAASKALRIATVDLDKKEIYVKRLNDKIVEELSIYPEIKINRTKYCIPHILNISLMNIKAETFIHAMEEHEIFISTNTACSNSTLSTSVMAIYNDTKRAMTTIRISIASITTNEEINRFIDCFHEEYKNMLKTQL